MGLVPLLPCGDKIDFLKGYSQREVAKSCVVAFQLGSYRDCCWSDAARCLCGGSISRETVAGYM